MSLKIGIVGLPNVGKSTLFQALTKKMVDTSNYPFATIDPNIGVVPIEDPRLTALTTLSKSERTVPAIVEFVDIAGLVKGAWQGEGLGNQFLSHIREVDAVVEVIRAFENENIIHVESSIDPERDRGIIETEFFMADLATAEKAFQRAERDAKKGTKEARAYLESISSIIEYLKKGESLPPSHYPIAKELSLLSIKPVLHLYNIIENTPDMPGVSMNIKFEEELASMSLEEKRELGIEPRLSLLVREAFRLLALINFFTTGADETRAWTIPRGSSAKRAGRAIHSDFEEKFIRAEVIFWEELVRLGSIPRAREAGLLRIEGKDYVVQDGDVIEFKI